MVSLSKLFDHSLKSANCGNVYHPGSTCLQFQFKHTSDCLSTSLKYFFLPAVLPLVLKGRNIREKHVWETLKYYTELVIIGYVVSQSVPIALCGTRKLFGRFNKHTFAYIPVIIASYPTFFVSAKAARLFSTSLFQVVLEAALLSKRNVLTRTIVHSRLIQTLLFMVYSAFILHAVQKHDVNVFWLFKSFPAFDEKIKNNKCLHNGLCLEFCLSEVAKTCSIGILLDLIKALTGNSPEASTFGGLLKTKLLRLDFPTTWFLSSYTGIFRLTHCLLTQNCKTDPQINQIVSGFLGGMAYYFLPRLTLLCFGTSVSIQICWQLFKRHKFGKKTQFAEKVKRLPFDRAFTSIGAAYASHLYVFRPHVLPPLGKAIILGLTGNQAPVITSNIIKYLSKIKASS